MPKSKWMMMLLACLVLAGGAFYWQKEWREPPAEVVRNFLEPPDLPEISGEGRPETMAETSQETMPEPTAETIVETTAETGPEYFTDPPEKETEAAPEWVFATQPLMVNLNTADAAQLQKLPGIGPGKAQAILQYRQEHGPFQAIEELMRVPGIKEGTFAKLKAYVTV